MKIIHTLDNWRPRINHAFSSRELNKGKSAENFVKSLKLKKPYFYIWMNKVYMCW